MKYTGRKENVTYVNDRNRKSSGRQIYDKQAYSRQYSEDYSSGGSAFGGRAAYGGGSPYDSYKEAGAVSAAAAGNGKNRGSGNGSAGNGGSGNGSAGISKTIIVLGIVFLVLQLLVSVTFLYLFISFDIFADYMVVIAVSAVVSLLAVAGVLQYIKKRGTKIAGMIVSLFMCAVMLVGSFAILRADDVLRAITGTSYSISTYKVAVLIDDPAESISDAADYTFGTMSGVDTDHFEEAMKEINAQAGKTVDTIDYATVPELYTALFEQESQAIVYESSYESIMEDMDEDYLSKIKYIGEIIIRTQNKSSIYVSDVDVLNSPYAIFISGSDEWNEVSTTGRSDVNMLVVVNPAEHQVLLVTIPRDYYVTFPGITGDSRDKLTHAGIYGIDVQLATIENLFGMDPIDYYVKINFSSLVEIVDAIGGLDIYNPYAFTTTSDEGYSYEEGQLHLSGIEALWYVRERKSIADGDFARGVHQMLVIEALINQICSASSIANFNALMDALEDCAITNMPDSSIKAIVQEQLTNNPSWDIQMAQAQGGSEYQPSYAAGGQYLSMVIPYQESVDYISDLISRVMAGELLVNIEDEAPDGGTYVVGLEDTTETYDESYDYDEEITFTRPEDGSWGNGSWGDGSGSNGGSSSGNSGGNSGGSSGDYYESETRWNSDEYETEQQYDGEDVNETGGDDSWYDDSDSDGSGYDDEGDSGYDDEGGSGYDDDGGGSGYDDDGGGSGYDDGGGGSGYEGDGGSGYEGDGEDSDY